MISTQLKKLRKKHSLTQIQFAEIFNISNGTIAMWETEKRQPDNDMLMRIANYFNVSVDYILGRSETEKENRGVMIPVLGRVIAGLPIEAVEEIIDYEEITEEMARNGEYFALKIKGNSMSPRIEENDVVIVRKQSYVDNGNIAIVLINGYEATCKKIHHNENGITLISLNNSYSPMFYTKEECEKLPVQIICKVVELRGKF